MTVSGFDVPRSRRAGRAVVPAVLALLGLLVLAQVAHAHATGLPPHATLAADGDVVTIDWIADADDAAAVGVVIGHLPDEVVDAYLGWGPVEDLPSDAQIRALSEAPELRDYLLANVAVTQDGRACDGAVRPAENFIVDGARFTFTCHAPVDHVDVRITILHDKDPLYRTFGVDGTYQTTVHTSSRPEHTWDFTGASALPPGVEEGATVPWRGVGGAGTVLLLAALLAVGWRRRSAPADPPGAPEAPANVRV